jgi:hypothetical protein
MQRGNRRLRTDPGRYHEAASTRKRRKGRTSHGSLNQSDEITSRKRQPFCVRAGCYLAEVAVGSSIPCLVSDWQAGVPDGAGFSVASAALSVVLLRSAASMKPPKQPSQQPRRKCTIVTKPQACGHGPEREYQDGCHPQSDERRIPAPQVWVTVWQLAIQAASRD